MRRFGRVNWRSGDISRLAAANLVAYRVGKPDWISSARWSAIVSHVSRELLK